MSSLKAYGTYTVSFFCDMERFTDNGRYGELAHQVAAEATHRLHYRGLFSGHAVKPHHKAIDGVGDLLVGRLDLNVGQSLRD